jgi:hypothetical protein
MSIRGRKEYHPSNLTNIEYAFLRVKGEGIRLNRLVSRSTSGVL